MANTPDKERKDVPAEAAKVMARLASMPHKPHAPLGDDKAKHKAAAKKSPKKRA